MSDQTKTRLFTFYSYKGGVGRTMALANVACQLANKHGHDVIVVDWDLEAPGLHYYYGFEDEDLREHKGLLDYLLDFTTEVAKGKDGREPDLNEYLMELKEEYRQKIRFGSVRLMPCGRLDDAYMARVQALDWGRFYAEQEGFRIVETLKARCREVADLTLIDARAGQADIGATTTIQVPDAVVLLFTANRQNVQGVAEIARRLKRHPDRTAQGLPDPRLLLIPARIFVEEDRYNQWLEKTAKPVYQQLLDAGVLAREDQPKGLEQCILAVDPRYTFEEALPILDSESVRSHLKDAYAQLAEAIMALYEGRMELWPSESPILPSPGTPGISSTPAKKETDILRALDSAAERGDEYTAAGLRLELATILIQEHRLDEVQPLIQASLTFYRNHQDKMMIAYLLFMLGAVKHLQKDPDGAMDYYENAYEAMEEIGNPSSQGAILMAMGAIHVSQGRWDDAMNFYEQACKIYEESDNHAGKAGALGMTAQLCAQKMDFSSARSLLVKAFESANIADKEDVIGMLEAQREEIEKSEASTNSLTSSPKRPE